MKFSSKVDGWYYIFALGFPIAVVAVVVSSLGTIESSELIVVGLVCAVAVTLPIWLLFSTFYVVQSDFLEIRSGPFKWQISLSDIKSVQPTRSVLSSPALSLNRLKISYGRRKSILVSPKDMDGFKNALAVQVT
jgi:hypothetical protein